jgi:GT2 family glycosyltransferase
MSDEHQKGQSAPHRAGLAISVIIPTYNRRVILKKCLNNLSAQTLPSNEFEVIIVDDASDDGTAEMVADLSTPYQLRYIPLSQRTGPGGARNVGIRAAQAELIVFLDSDLVPAPELLAAHLAIHAEHTNRIGHGPVIHTTDLDNPTATPMKVTDISRAFFATGNVSVRKEHLLAAGLFDEDFREYGWEDLELGRRLRRLGLEAVPVPEAKGWHYKASLKLSQLPGLVERERQRARTAIIYYHKHPELKVRLSTEIVPFIFYLDKLFSIGKWPERPSTQTMLERLETKGRHGILRFLVRLVTHHAYMDELRRALPKDDPARRYVR